MATANHSDSRLTVELDAGVDDDGQPVFKRKSFNNVKTDASNDAIYNIVEALMELQQHTTTNIERQDSYILTA